MLSSYLSLLWLISFRFHNMRACSRNVLRNSKTALQQTRHSRSQITSFPWCTRFESGGSLFFIAWRGRLGRFECCWLPVGECIPYKFHKSSRQFAISQGMWNVWLYWIFLSFSFTQFFSQFLFILLLSSLEMESIRERDGTCSEVVV